MKLNLGAGTYPMKGWLNCDITYPKGNDDPDKVWLDLRLSIPWVTDSVDEVYMGHFLEHLTESEGKACLAEVRRVLKPGGKLTVIVPDMRNASGLCLKGHITSKQFFAELILGYENWGSCQEDLARDGTPPHKSAFDLDLLFEMLVNAGFIGVCPIDIETHPYVVSRFPTQAGCTCVKSRT